MADYDDGKKGPIPEPIIASTDLVQQVPHRPPIDYSSSATFFKSLGQRWKSVWTKRFILSLVFGQIVSLCITCTNVTTAELVQRGLSLPTMQNNFLYFSLFLIFTPYTMYKYGIKGWGKLVLRDGWRYFILAACDVEGNFLAVKAYSYTDLLSCMLLDAWAIPVCLFFSWVYMKPRYHWTQILGVLICIGGLALLVVSDLITGKNYQAVSKSKGDAFMFAAATLYGITNATEEFFVRRRPLYEVVGQLGMFGFIINGIQASALEHDLIKHGNWNGATVGLILAYTGGSHSQSSDCLSSDYILAMLILYTVAPRFLWLIIRQVDISFAVLPWLTFANAGLFLFHYRPFWLYFISFAVVIVGLITYFWSSAPEEQGVLNPQTPDYVQKTRSENDVEQDVDQEGEVVVPSLARV
ncbi:hypothetical protein APHAL10511_004875 [Amanita phalloides]|nr:hypothetical protein APHAL10511_004875 [Amanita phalloides]